MSLRSVTEKIDTFLTVAVLAFCLCVWAAVGFPHVVEVGAAACLILVIFGAVWCMNSRQSG